MCAVYLYCLDSGVEFRLEVDKNTEELISSRVRKKALRTAVATEL